MKESYAKKLRLSLVACQVSPAMLARAMGLPDSTVHCYTVQGKAPTVPRWLTMKKAAASLGATLSDAIWDDAVSAEELKAMLQKN